MAPRKSASVKKSVFQQADGPLIKADKNFFVLIPLWSADPHNPGGEGRWRVERHPVVAWRCTKRRLAEPILATAAHEGLPFAIEYPGGLICSPQGGCWGGEREWLASIASRAAPRKRLSHG